MDTRSTRRAASRTDADGPGVGNEAGADGAAETGGQQPSPGGTASSSRDPPVPLLETARAWLQDFFAFVAPVRDALARTPPMAALPKLDVPTFTGHAAGASITDFLDDLSVYRSPAVRGPRYPPSRGRVRTVATWTVLDSTDRPVAWTSRLPWEIQPRPLLGDPPLDAPEPFRGLLLSDRHPIEPSQPYTAKETRILCRVSEISRRAHQDGSLHRSRLLAATIRDTILRPPQPPPAPTTVEAAVALLRSARPDLLAQGVLPAPTSVPPPTLPPQPPVDDLLDFDE
ncbi:hypothetical protein HPB52_025232 [Rhipicephalus sanguineus]|uniref:Uncharacterized protein n=1 Tax=Rhipicephalus sanguineus TaxID=34632 RepID=A0A9D4PAV1_RHISA|nr:hypothetical protein HPB52_025232 [Rhipicephalus sanguineus]